MPAQQLTDAKANKAKIVKTAASKPGNGFGGSAHPSSQQLMGKEEQDGFNFTNIALDGEAVAAGIRSRHRSSSPNHITATQWITVSVLFFVNLINYMDRLTIAGILSKIQSEYHIGDAEGGALQTAFVVSYTIFAPIFGYLGDRYSRKAIMAFGVFLWTVFTVIGSFMPSYNWFLICRAMVGVGEASYSTIAPTIISDLFVKDVRSKMLAFFYFAIPVGSGLGYVVGAETTNIAGGDWRWGLRVTPILGFIAVFLIIFCMIDPPRGESEGHGELKATSYRKDLRSLARNRSFMLSTVAFTCVAFCTGALSWWGPSYIENAVASSHDTNKGSISVSNVALIFGFITMLSGIVGVPLGSILSTKLKQKYPRADPIICGVGLILSAVLLAAGMFTATWNIHLAFALLFLGEVTLNLNWSIVADILLYVVVPTRRSTAEAVQILVSHAFGDAGSPYLIGLVSDALRTSLSTETVCKGISGDKPIPGIIDMPHMANKTQCEFAVDYQSMQYSLLINNFVELIGGIFFFVTAFYIVRDKLKCDRYVAEHGFDEDCVARKLEKKLMLNAYPPQVFKGVESESSLSTSDDEDLPPQLQLIPEQQA